MCMYVNWKFPYLNSRWNSDNKKPRKQHTYIHFIKTPIRGLKFSVDPGYLLENVFFMHCFKENHGKLFIIVKLIIINSRIRK